MTHHDAWDLLDQFLDGALAADARWAVAAHLNECAMCRTQVATQARLRGLVRERLTAIETPSGLSARLTSALATEAMSPNADAERRRSPLPVRWVALVGPALAALWLVIAFAVPASRADADLTRELVATHALFAHDESLLDVAGDTAAVTTWFRETAGVQIAAPQLEGYTLVGGRLIALDGRPVAQLVYEGKPDDTYLSLLRFPHDGFHAGPIALQVYVNDGLALHHSGPMSLATWVSGEERVALVGTVPSDELRRLAGDLAARSENASLPNA
jgi:anti-sigma factor RsiW